MSARGAIGLALALVLPAAASAAEVTRGPYVQIVSADAATVVWRTDAPTLGKVAFGAAVDDLSRTVSATAAFTQHELRLTGLEPRTRYCYAIEDESGRIAGGREDYCFRTAPATGSAAPFRVWVVGDSGTGTGKQGRVRDAMWIETQGVLPDVYVHVGDMAYSSGTNDELQERFFEMYPRILRQVAAYPAIGNHEGTSSDSLTATGPYYDAYALPTRAEAGGLSSGTEAYYSWDWGNAHFIALESHRAELRVEDGAMLQWLQMDLEATDAEWIIAYFHHPPYTKGSHDSDTEISHVDMRERVMPILEAAGVDLVLGGHSHIYERSYLVHGAYDTPTTAGPHIVDPGDGKAGAPYHKGGPGGADDGAIYIVAGHGGTNVGRDGDVEHPLMYFTEIENGSVLVDFDGRTMRIQNVRLDGAISDDFHLVKGEALHLTGPAPRARIGVGQPVPITWISEGSPRTIDLAYSSDEGATWRSIGQGLPDTGTYDWTPPADAEGQVNLRITDTNQPALSHTNHRRLHVAPAAPAVLVDFGSGWRHSVAPPPPTWTAPDFDDRRWKREPASFGVCSCLPWESGNITYLADALGTVSVYFRTTFTTEQPTAYLDLSVIHEVGAVVYLNGQEVLRRHITNLDHEARADPAGEGLEVTNTRVDGSLVEVGVNSIAVMIKKGNVVPLNLTFDLKATAVPGDPKSEGCGCRGASGGDAGGALLGGLVLLAALRRRRHRA